MLISVLVMSAVLLLIVIGVSETQVTSSYQQLNTRSNKSSYYIAESCFEEASQKIKMDINYSGGTITFDYGTCTISIIGSTTKIVSISTTFENYTQNHQAEITVIQNGEINNVRLLNWQKN